MYTDDVKEVKEMNVKKNIQLPTNPNMRINS